MKQMPAVALCLLALSVSVQAQGTFLFSNLTAPTRLGSIDGPLAGPGIWAQPLGGFTPDSLTPLYVFNMPVEHITNGLIPGREVHVPGAPIGTTYYVQLVAWNGTIWGTNLANVPLNQQGFSDTVTLTLESPTGVTFSTDFTRPAVVPAIPEPSALALVVFGGAILFLRRCRT